MRFQADEANTAADEMTEAFAVQQIIDFTAGATPGAEVGEADNLRRKALFFIAPDGVAVFQVEHHLGCPPVDTVSAAADIELTVEHEGGKRAIVIAGDARPEAGSQVAPPAEQAIEPDVVPGDQEAARFAEGSHGLGDGLVVAAGGTLTELIQSVKRMTELEQQLLQISPFGAGGDFTGLAYFSVAFIEGANAQRDGLPGLKGVAAINAEGEVAVAIVDRSGGKVEGFHRGVAPALQCVAPTAAVQGGVPEAQVVVVLTVITLVEGR